MYESKISDAKWIAYDISGNVGWSVFLVGLILCFIKRPEILEDRGNLRLIGDGGKTI